VQEDGPQNGGRKTLSVLSSLGDARHVLGWEAMSMRSLVIYHSRYGNTERIAQAVARGLSERGEVRALPLGDLAPGDLARAHLVVLGAPTQMKGIPFSLRSFLRRSPRAWWFGRPAAAFDTRFPGELRRTGSAATKLAGRLERMGALLLVPPESFFVAGMKGPLEDGELVRAELWGRGLHLSTRITAEE
jgi:flavodoxin